MSADSPPLAVDARPPGLIQAHALFPSPSGAKRVTCGADGLGAGAGETWGRRVRLRPLPSRSHHWRARPALVAFVCGVEQSGSSLGS